MTAGRDDLLLEETLILRFTSDWRVGTGAGRPGGADRVLRRDADGLPVLPAKTLRGIWRDATELIARALDDGDPAGGWAAATAALFGDEPTRAKDPVAATRSPRPGVVQVATGRLPEALRERLGRSTPGAARLREALVLLKPGVKLDPRSGRALDEHLRFDEVGRRGMAFEVRVRADLSSFTVAADRVALGALLLAGWLHVERLGAERRRGSGRCTVARLGDHPIDGEELAGALDREPPRLERSRPAPYSATAKEVAAEESWHAVSLRLVCEDPLITGATMIGNVVRGRDFVPGAQILPAVLAAIDAAAGRPGAGREALVSGCVIVTDATPEVDGERGRPVPFNLSYVKGTKGLGDGEGVRNAFCDAGEPGTELREHREGWIGPTVTGGLPAYERIDLTATTHATIDERAQRPTSDVGGVYTYEAIPAGTALRAEVRFRGSVLEHPVSALGEHLGNLRLGRSKRDEYGGVRVEALRDCFLDEPIEPRNGTLAILLRSDALLIDGRGRPAPTVGALLAALGAALSAPGDIVELALQAGSARARARRSESWHARWSLPRESLVGLQAGTSCLAEVVEGTVTPTTLARVEAEGIGQRRAEGFGQVQFGEPLIDEPAAGRVRLTPTGPSAVGAHDGTSDGEVGGSPDEVLLDPARLGPSLALAREIEEATWRIALERAAVALGADEEGRQAMLPRSAGKPSRAQLSALRGVAADVARCLPHDPDGASKVVDTWKTAVTRAAARREAWPSRPRGRAVALLKREQSASPWSTLGAILERHEGLDPFTDGSDMTICTAPAELRTKLEGVALRVLVDALVRGHARADQRGEAVG